MQGRRRGSAVVVLVAFVNDVQIIRAGQQVVDAYLGVGGNRDICRSCRRRSSAEHTYRTLAAQQLISGVPHGVEREVVPRRRGAGLCTLIVYGIRHRELLCEPDDRWWITERGLNEVRFGGRAGLAYLGHKTIRWAGKRNVEGRRRGREVG